MSIITGDGIQKFGSWTALESSGASVSAGAMSAVCTTECTATQHLDAPLLAVGISAEFGANTPTADSVVEVYYKTNDIGAASQDGNAPTTAYKQKYWGSQTLKAVAGTQYLEIDARAFTSENFDFYILNGDDTDAMTWKLYVKPIAAGAKT